MSLALADGVLATDPSEKSKDILLPEESNIEGYH